MRGSPGPTATSSHRRLAGLATAAIALLAGGCAGATGPGAAAARPEAPREGQCSPDVGWPAQRTPSAPPPIVECTQQHGSEIWRVVDLPEPWSDPSAPRPAPGSPQERELAAFARDRCADADWRRYANVAEPTEVPPGTRSFPTPLRPLWFYPSPEHWSAGARWLRCDLGFEWSGGSRSKIRFAGSLRRAHDPRTRLILSSDCWAGAQDPANAENRPCDQPHDAEVVSVYRIARADPAPSAMTGDWAARCRDDAARYLGIEPGPDGTPGHRFEYHLRPAARSDWDAGDRTVACWLSFVRRTDGTRVTTREPAVGLATADPVPVAEP